MVIGLERGADLHMAQLMPLPLTVSCSSKVQIGFTFLVPAHPGSPGKRAVKRVCVVLLSIFGLQCFDTAGWVAGRASSLYLVPAHPGSPGKRAVKRVCVCVCVFVLLSWPFDYF